MAWSSFLLCGGSEPHPAVRAHPGMDWTFCFGCDEDVQSHRTLRRVQNLFTETDELRGSRETAQRTSSVVSTEEAKRAGTGLKRN